MKRITLMFMFALVIVGFPIRAVSAQEMPMLELPPGIADLAQPLLEAMMDHMQQMGMSPEQMESMMADMQTMADSLPQGIFLEILKLMPQLDMEEMMSLHQQMHQGDLLQQAPGEILVFVRRLAR